jgi:hypothetical protein
MVKGGPRAAFFVVMPIRVSMWSSERRSANNKSARWSSKKIVREENRPGKTTKKNDQENDKAK